MSTDDLTLDLLAHHPFPHLAAAVRARADFIIPEWEIAVRGTLPAADELTLQQLRNSLPSILEEVADGIGLGQTSCHPRTDRGQQKPRGYAVS